MASTRPVFLRDATGLVRTWTWQDGFMFCAIGMPVGLWSVLVIATNSYAFPGGDPILGVILSIALFLPVAVLYSMLSSTMPRAGGDYVFESRILHPTVAFVVMGLYLLADVWYFVFVGPTVAAAGFAPFFAGLATLTGNQWFSSVATWFTTTQAVVILNYVAILFAWVVSVFGMRIYGLAQRVSFIIGVLTWAIVFAVLSAVGHQTFVTNFNSIAASLGGSSTDAYNSIIDLAGKNGFNPDFSFSWYQTIATVATWSTVIAYPNLYAFVAGEIKKADNFGNQLKMSVASLVTVGVMILLLVASLDSLVGRQFNGAANYLYSIGQYPLSIPPYVGLFAVVALPGVFSAILVFIFFNSWAWMNTAIAIPINSRISLAMAFDRLFPSKMAQVNDTFATPVINITVWCLVGALLDTIYWQVPASGQLFYLSSLFVSAMFICTGLSGVILPYRNKTKNIWNTSPISRYKLAGIPVISIVGAFTIGVWVFITYLLLTDPHLGIAGSNIGLSATFTVVCVVLFLTLYFARYQYYKARGINLLRAFDEIPPE